MPLVLVAALLFVIEDVLWAWGTALAVRFAHLPVFAALGRFIAGLGPYASLVVFLASLGVVYPLKLGAMWLIHNGDVALGAGVFAGAQILGFFVCARVYAISKDKLLTIGWFAVAVGWLAWARDGLYASVKALPGWQAVVAAARGIRDALRRMVRGRGRSFVMSRLAAIRRRWKAA